MFLLTLNTWKCEGDYTHRISTLARHLSVLQPDVIMLQEVFAAPEVGADTSRSLSKRLPDHRCIPATARNKLRMYKDQEVISISGLATFIKGTSSRNRIVQLPALPNDRDRVAHVVEANINGHDIQLVNLHLTHIRGSDKLRLMQLRTVLDQLNDKPVIIGGDFNSRPESETIAELHARFDAVMVSPVPTGPGGGVIDYFAFRGLDIESVQLEPLFDGTVLPKVSDHIGLGLHLRLRKDSRKAS